MTVTAPLGFFGKLPSHGDFVDRALPRLFIGPWDEWLQTALATSRELLGTDWLDYYLVSPIWRFVLSPGICGPDAWHGLVMPSVDRVNRYFPLTIAMPQAPTAPTLARLTRGEDWFRRCEEVALSALSTRVDADALAARLEAIAPDVTALGPARCPAAARNGVAWQFGLPQEQPPDLLDTILAESLLRRGGAPYSLWWSEGSQTIQKSMLVHEGLPTARAFTAMLDGQWSRWGWGTCPVLAAGVEPRRGSAEEEAT